MTLFYAHAGAAATGLLLLAAGVTVARFYRQKRTWLKWHRTAGIAGLVCFLAALAAAVTMVSQSGEGHLKVPHTWIGTATLLFSLAAPALGQLQFTRKAKERIKPLKTMHRWSGRITLAASLPTLVSGLRAAGLI